MPSPGSGSRRPSAAWDSRRWSGVRRHGPSCGTACGRVRCTLGAPSPRRAGRTAPPPMAALTPDPIPVDRLLAGAARPDCGAVALFLGATRDHHQGREVVRLCYEAYEPMALEALSSLERETVARFPVVLCRIVHRLGEVPLAEASVAVVVAAGHRGPAFEACRWAMDELKRTVPIWKKESYAGGGEGWVEGTRLS